MHRRECTHQIAILMLELPAQVLSTIQWQKSEQTKLPLVLLNLEWNTALAGTADQQAS